MQKDETVRKGLVYSRGFFAFLCGTAVIGILLGTMCFCLEDTEIAGIGCLGGNIDLQRSVGADRMLAGSLWRNTVFLLGVGIAGLCPLGHPLELALLMIRGMAAGYSMARLYSVTGKDAVICCIGLMLPGTVIGMLGLIATVREALCLSGIYLRLTLSDKPVCGLSETIKLYGAKLLAAEALLALAAGADTLCSFLFIGKLSG